MLKDAKTEISQIERRKFWVEGADEIFVEPLRLFDLKAYPLNGFEFLLGEIDNKSYA